MVTPWPLRAHTLALKVPVALAFVALVVRLVVFPPLVIVIVGAVVDVGAPAKLPVALAAVALFVSTSVLDVTVPLVFVPLVMLIVPGPGTAVKVPVEDLATAFVVMASVFEPLPMLIEVPDTGGGPDKEKVPTALDPVPLLVRVKVVGELTAPLVMVIEVLL